jgi:hypothetical protein
MELNSELKFEPSSSPPGFDLIAAMGMSTEMHRPGFVDAVALSLKRSCVTAVLLRMSTLGAFNMQDMRMKIRVGAMPCVIGVLSPQRFSLQVTNTHVDLQGNPPEDEVGRVPNDVEGAEGKLCGQIEHAALDDNGECNPTCSYREVLA